MNISNKDWYKAGWQFSDSIVSDTIVDCWWVLTRVWRAQSCRALYWKSFMARILPPCRTTRHFTNNQLFLESIFNIYFAGKNSSPALSLSSSSALRFSPLISQSDNFKSPDLESCSTHKIINERFSPFINNFLLM